METKHLQIACFNAIVNGLSDVDHGWDMAAASILHTAMLKKSLIPTDVSTMQIYNAMLPAFGIDTTETDQSPCSFQAPDHNDMQKENIGTKFLDEVGVKKIKRIYIEMEVLYDKEGKMTPTVLHWMNGAKYPIERVTDVRHTANLKYGASGGAGIRYSVQIFGKERYLWFVEGKWFVESC